MVVVGTGSSSSRFIRTNYPNTEGLTAGTNKLPDEALLEPEVDLLTDRKKVGLYGKD